MKIAVLTLARDRLAYTQHCFQTLRDNAGCAYDHYVLDQASEDGTAEWLDDQDDLTVFHVEENLGVSGGLNYLLDRLEDDYDVVCHFDNDCEVTQPNTLRDLADLVDYGALLSPRVLGLQNPPPVLREMSIRDETILEVNQVGGIFLSCPGWVYDEFRYTPNSYDDVEICHWWREQGGTVGYVKRLEVWHYETTAGQRERFPDYFARHDIEYAERFLVR